MAPTRTSTFTVFQDPAPVPSSSSSPPPTPAATVPVTLAEKEKENLHPLTGARASAGVAGTKRKGAVLATKMYLSPGKKVKESKEGKVKEGSSGKAKETSKGKPAKKRKAVGRKTRRVSPLPKVEEEERERTVQAEVNSRCYDLTVLPLADVTPAYDERAGTDGSSAKLRIVKEPSAEPEIGDYFSPPLGAAKRAPSSSPAKEVKVFSTPERKRIYSAFTFSSPSPSSDRLRKVAGCTGVPPFRPIATP